MRPQQLCFLQTPFKMKAAKSATTKTPGLPTAQTGGGFVAAASALSMLVPQTAMYGHSTPIRLKPPHPTLPLAANFLLSLDQQFHSTACALKSEDGGKGNNNNGDKPTQNNSSDEHGGGGVEPTQQQRGKRGQSLGDADAIRRRLPKCKDCGAPLRNSQRTENINSNMLECSNCGIIYARSAGGSNAYHQILDRKMEERMRIQTPREIKAYLDQYVIGQDHAKHHLALGVYEHYIRVHNNEQFRSNTSTMAESKFAAALPQQPGHVRPINEFSQDIMSSRGGSGTFIPQSMSQQKQQTLKKKTPALFHSPSPIHHHSGEQQSGVKMEKSNILLLGPSGVGKTHMVKVLAEALDVPMAQCDCTSLTQAGYVGEDVESVLQKLLQEADGDIQKAQHGIVYLDEFDKISMKESANSASNRDVGGEGVQHAMLKMVEGTVVTVPKNRKGQGPQEAVSLDTTDILFIASGAFTGIEKYISRRLEKKTMGFGSTQSANTITMDDKEQAEINAKRDRLLKQVRSEDVINFGMIPELVGRFPTRVPFHSLDKDSLKRVLTVPKNSLMDQAKMFFSWHNAKLEVTDEALDEIAHLALKEKVGARALISHLYQVLWESKYELPGSDIDTVRITAEYVRGEGRYEVILKDRPATAAQHNNNKQQGESSTSSRSIPFFAARVHPQPLPAPKLTTNKTPPPPRM